MRKHVGVRHVVFVVIVPDMSIAAVNQLAPDAVFPKPIRAGIREVQIARHAAPEREAGGAAVRVVQEPAVGCDRIVQRVLRHKGGLDIRDQVHAVLLKVL